MLVTSAQEIQVVIHTVARARDRLSKTLSAALKGRKAYADPKTWEPVHDLDNAVDFLRNVLLRTAPPAMRPPVCADRNPYTGSGEPACKLSRDHDGKHDSGAETWSYPSSERAPVATILACPMCHARHIDRGDFATKPHHTHACQTCGHCWRPAIVATVGVQFLPGFKDKEPST